MASALKTDYCYSCKGNFPKGTIILHNTLTDKKVRFCSESCIKKYTDILREADKLKLPDNSKWTEETFHVTFLKDCIFDFEGDDD